MLSAPFAKPAREALRKSLTAENLKQEAAYLRGEGRASFERPYGLAWLLQLVAELKEWDEPQAKEMAANLRPLEEAALRRLSDWLPKLSNPVRIGEHDQTAFALSLILDYTNGNGGVRSIGSVGTQSSPHRLTPVFRSHSSATWPILHVGPGQQVTLTSLYFKH